MSAFNRRQLLQGGAAASMLAASAGIARASQVDGGVLRIGIDGFAPDHPLVAPFLFDTLTEVDATGALRGSLASRWVAGDGGRQWRVTVDPQARWHDGTAVTADQVADALMSCDPKLPMLDRLWVEDTETLVFDLLAPSAGFPFLLADPRFAVRKPGRSDMGTGPYRLADAAALARLQPGRGRFDRIEYIFSSIGSAGRDALLDGAVDMALVRDPLTVNRRFTGLSLSTIGSERLEIVASGPCSDVLAAAMRHGVDRAQLLAGWVGEHGQIGHDHPFVAQSPPKVRHIDHARSLIAGRNLRAVEVDLTPALLSDPASNRLLRAVARDARAMGLRLSPKTGASPNLPRLTLRSRPVEVSPEAALWAARDGGFEACATYHNDLVDLFAGGDSAKRLHLIDVMTQRLSNESRTVVPAFRNHLVLHGPRIRLAGSLRSVEPIVPRAA